MTSPRPTRRFCRAAALSLSAALLSATAGGAAVAQSPPSGSGPAAAALPPGAPTSPPPAPSAAPLFPPQPAPKRGVFNNFGGWWQHPVASFSSEVKDARTKLDSFNKGAVEATKDAAAAIARLPSMRVIDVHERCAKAPNGAPDCQSAATDACRLKGFKSGQPLGITSSEACPSAVLLSGQTPAEGDCPIETVVLQAVCQ